MAYFETGGLNFLEVLGLAILFIWAVNRYFRKRNEADENDPMRYIMEHGAIEEEQAYRRAETEEIIRRQELQMIGGHLLAMEMLEKLRKRRM